MTAWRNASAEESKKTGGMVALFLRTHDNQKLVINGGEPEDDLHCTVVFLGEDVRDDDPTELVGQLDYISGNYGPLEAKIFAHAAFNPTGDEPCAVYLVGGNSDLSNLYRELKGFVEGRYPGAASQHDPWTPHITAGYNMNVAKLDYTGPVLFDRIGLRWPGHDQDWTL